MPYTCQVCGEGQKGKWALQNHIRDKHKEVGDGKPAKKQKRSKVTCETCGKVMLERYYNEIHRKIHLDEKDHVCEVCGKAFANPRAMKMHILVVMTEGPLKSRCL